MFQIHHLFNESEKTKVAYKCGQREYLRILFRAKYIFFSINILTFYFN